MTKINICADITEKIKEDCINIVSCLEYGQNIPSIRNGHAYKDLIAYFQSAQYLIKNGGSDKKLFIKHKKYSTLKINENKGYCGFYTFPVIFNHDSLEVKIVMNIPILNKEFKITAVRMEENQYTCNELCYNNESVFSKSKKNGINTD